MDVRLGAAILATFAVGIALLLDLVLICIGSAIVLAIGLFNMYLLRHPDSKYSSNNFGALALSLGTMVAILVPMWITWWFLGRL